MVFSFSVSGQSQTVGTLAGPGCGITDGLVLDSQGNLFGCDFEGTTVYKVTPAGNVSPFATGFNHPNGMTIDANDNIYLASTWDHAIFKIDPAGTTTQYGPTITNPNGVIFEADSDTLIVASYALNQIYKLAPDGTVSYWISGGELNGPLGMTYDDDDRLYIANFNDGKVLRVDGDQLVEIAAVPSGDLWGGDYACGFLTYASGYLYATGIAVNYVYRISLDGELSVFAGCGIAGHVDGDALSARFSQPNGIVPNATGDTLYVSDFTTQTIRTISGFTSDVPEFATPIPLRTELAQNSPNPFNLTTLIPFTLATPGEVHLTVVDVLGRQVASLLDGTLSAGRHVSSWNGLTRYGTEAASGVYFIRLETQDVVEVRKMTFVM